MILIGQYDSPFVRRVGIALTLYGLDFAHQPWSVFSDAVALRAINPLMRVPVLVLADGSVLTDSHMILDHLDSLMPDPLFPRAEPARRRALGVAALACGLADKAVSLFYERRLHDVASQVWKTRCEDQIAAVLTALEADLSARPGPFWFGDQPGHADIAVACALRFADEAHPGLIDWTEAPALAALCGRLEQTAAFRSVAQAFAAPA